MGVGIVACFGEDPTGSAEEPSSLGVVLAGVSVVVKPAWGDSDVEEPYVGAYALPNCSWTWQKCRV